MYTLFIDTHSEKLLIGLLKAARVTLQSMGIAREITDLIQACILVFIALQYPFESGSPLYISFTPPVSVVLSICQQYPANLTFILFNNVDTSPLVFGFI